MIMQMEVEECGAACLAMISAYHGKHIPLERVRTDCAISRDGSNALYICNAAERYGFRVNASSCNLAYLYKEATFPCILHWKFTHFVVLTGFSGSHALINDPARGRVRVSQEELNSSFTGICMEFTPTKEFRKEGRQQTVSTYLEKRLKRSFWGLVYVMLSTLFASVTALTLPALYRFFIDSVLPTAENGSLVSGFVFFFLGILLFSIIANIVNELATLRFRGKLTIVSNAEFLWHCLRLPMEFFSQRYSADITNRQSENDFIASTLTESIAPLFSSVLLLIIYIILMARYSLALTGIALVAIICEIASTRLATAQHINYANSTMIDKSAMRANTVNGIEMIETIKALGAENGFFNRWAGISCKLNRSQVDFTHWSTLFQIIPSLLVEIANIIILALGMDLIIKGEFTVGMLLAFQSYMSGFMAPAKRIISSRSNIDQMKTSLTRVGDILAYPEDRGLKGCDVDEETVLEKLQGDIDIQDLTFGYSAQSDPTFSHFSLHIPRGKSIAFVGLSGCGKSTLVKLLCGLYQPWSGQILFDGKLRSAYPHTVMTSSIGVINQEISMFEDTLMENLKMWDRTIDNEVVIQACRDAQIHEEIMLRNGGYDCTVMEGGKNFSGGQLQRFEIARTLALMPTILILDEATSALDAGTEWRIMKKIEERKITQIIVSHRLSAIRDADEIVVFDHGKIVERGQHEALFAAGGPYSHLVTME